MIFRLMYKSGAPGQDFLAFERQLHKSWTWAKQFLVLPHGSLSHDTFVRAPARLERGVAEALVGHGATAAPFMDAKNIHVAPRKRAQDGLVGTNQHETTARLLANME
jgi:hypothetical protein